jgi:polyhydroxybutyrate depolymerase
MRLRACPVIAFCFAALSLAPALAAADSLVSGGIERHYEVFRPEGTTEPRPAVFLLHGGAGTADGMRRYTGFDSLAAEAGLVAVYPQGIERRWNDGRARASQLALPRDDQFLLDLADHLSAVGLVDRRRVYIAGISNGGIMALQMACSYADRIAGIAVIAASLPLGFRCQPQRGLPVIFFNGTQDRFIPFMGGPIASQFGGGRGSVISVEQSLEIFARSAGCGTRHAQYLAEPAPPDGTRVKLVVYDHCRPGAALESVVIEGGGHSWPGARQGLILSGILGPATRAIEANVELWRFFSRNPLLP